MKTTTVKVGRIHITTNALAPNTRRAAADLALHIAAQVERRSGTRLPSAAADRIADRLAPALLERGRR
jgi:hypothetical protein